MASEKRLVIFSIITSVLSAGLGFVQRFIKSLGEVDKLVIFFSGIFVLIVVAILLYLLSRELIRRLSKKKKYK